MGKRKIYLNRYKKVISHLKCNTEIDELYFLEIKDCMKNIERIKGAKGDAITSYFNHIDFILENIFGIEVAGIKELTKEVL